MRWHEATFPVVFILVALILWVEIVAPGASVALITSLWTLLSANLTQFLTALSEVALVVAAVASVVAARGSLAAATVMRQDMLMRQRPYVFADRLSARLIKLRHPSSSTSIVFGVQSIFVLRNVGTLPAAGIVRTIYLLGDEVIHDESRRTLLFPGQEEPVDAAFEKPEQMESIRSGQRVLHLHIRIEYTTVGQHGVGNSGYFSDSRHELFVSAKDNWEYHLLEVNGG